MDSKTIRHLLEKYWNGETSLKEESAISDYFNADNYDPSLKREAELFQYYKMETGLKLAETNSKNILDRVASSSKKKGRVIPLVWNGLKVAAVVTVLVTAVWLINNEIKDNPEQLDPIADTFSDPNEAFEETKKALLMISKNLGKGRTHAAKIKGFKDAEDKVRASGSKQKEKGTI